MEKPVTFLNNNRERLFGIVHIPEKNVSSKKVVGINLLNPGIKYRVAPNRLNVKIARRLCQNGYHVLRFDPSGIGDSEGALPNDVMLGDIAEIIQTGCFVKDTISSNDFFIKYFGITELVAVGNCGGAVTALLTSENDPRVSRLILIDLPIQFKKATHTFADKIVAGSEISNSLFYGYIKKILSPKAWTRFLTLKTDYRALWKIMKMKSINLIHNTQPNRGISQDIDEFCDERGLNNLLFNAFNKYAENNNRALFIMAGNDKSTDFLQKYFIDEFLTFNPHMAGGIDTFLIEDANHIYTLYEWQESLINKLCNWMNAR